MAEILFFDDELPRPITTLQEYFREGGATVIQAAFAHSYFVDPGTVRETVVYYPDRARRSREHYPGLDKGMEAVWTGNLREVILDDNSRAQRAWARYTGRPLSRGIGFSVRHIWGNPWNPDAFTAGWNLCYMPFWAGMLTEEQQRHEELEQAIRQASWDLYFRECPVCDPPDFVNDPGLDLDSLLDGQPLLILKPNSRRQDQPPNVVAPAGDNLETVRFIRMQMHQSWSNIIKAARNLQELDHEPFGTRNVENSSRACVRRIQRETNLSLPELELLVMGQLGDR